jgi:hypothetical protein
MSCVYISNISQRRNDFFLPRVGGVRDAERGRLAIHLLSAIGPANGRPAISRDPNVISRNPTSDIYTLWLT